MTQSHDIALPTLESIDQVADGWVKKYVLHYRQPDGSAYSYEAVSRKPLAQYEAELRSMTSTGTRTLTPDAVVIAPITRDGRLVFIREFRYAVNSWAIEFPAGLIDPGESVEATVERELHEESGFALVRDEEGRPVMRVLEQPGFSSAGFTDETVQIVFARVENEPILGQQTEANELIAVHTIPLEEIPHFLAENTTPMCMRAQLIFDAIRRGLSW